MSEDRPHIQQYPNPDRLKMGRLLRGMTQKEISTATGIDQSLVSKYENGRTIPETDLLAIAQVLQLPTDFFYRQLILYAPNGTSVLMFRRKQTTSVKVQDQVIMEMNRLSENVRILFNSVDLQTTANIPIHEPGDETVNGIEEIADRVRLELNIPPGPIPSIVRVLESMGVIIVRRSLPPKVDALVNSPPGERPVIILSNNLMGGRERFTLAHELGHMVMHNAINYPYKDLEAQGHRYGGSFLMPARDIKSKLRNLTMERLIALSAEWRVSVQALVRRAFDLEVITERQYRSWNVELGKSGFRTKEPVKIPHETPTLLNSLVQLHINELGYTVRELSEALAMEEWEFRQNYLGEVPMRILPKKKIVLRPPQDDTEIS